MNSVLNNLNSLNRALEGVVSVGKEFDGVAALWNNYYDGMARMSIHQQQQELQRQSQELTVQQEQPQGEEEAPSESTDEQAQEGNNDD